MARTQYLQQEDTGRIFIRTDMLAKRPDMRSIDSADAERIMARDRQRSENDAGGQTAESAGIVPDNLNLDTDDVKHTDDENVDEADDNGSEGGGTGKGDNKPPVAADEILALTTKADLEKFGRKHGIELDARKTVKNMQAELIEALGAK